MRITFALFVFVGLSTGTLAPVTVALAADAAAEEAKQHFFKGQQLFDVGRWDEAADEFEKAYSMRGDPTFIYNMAQSYRRKGDAKRALDLYKNYLIKAPKSPQRPEVEERIRALQKQLEEAEYQVKPAAQNAATTGAASPAAPLVPAPLPPPAAPASVAPGFPPVVYSPTAQPAPATPQAAGAASAQAAYPSAAPGSAEAYPPGPVPGALQPQPSYLAQQPVQLQSEATPAPVATPGHGLRVAGVVFGAVGVAAIGAGIFFGAEASSYSHSVETGSVFNPNFQDRGKLYETLQWVGYGVGAGFLATAAVLYGIGAASAKSPAVALAPSVFPGGAALSAQGVF